MADTAFVARGDLLVSLHRAGDDLVKPSSATCRSEFGELPVLQID
jgi:hypothetical protein